MQKYWWPSYVEHLLRELQRQQNTSQFCDTLLQTEALSPQLSERLSGSQPSQLGQKRKVRLDTMTAHTLLKLVGLLYSGEMEVQGSFEKDEVLFAARQFGITDLVEGRKDVRGKEGEPQENSCRNIQGGHFENGEMATDCPISKAPSVSVGTQTVVAEEKIVDMPLSRSGWSHPPLTVPSSPSGAPRDGGRNGVRTAGSLNDDLESQIAQEDISFQQFSEPEEDPTSLMNGPSKAETAEKTGMELNDREEPLQEETRATMKQMLGTTKISFKLKLVRTEGKAWEVLNGGDAHEMSALTSLKPRLQENNLLGTVDFTSVPKGHPVCMKMIHPLSSDLQINGSMLEGEGAKKLCGKGKRGKSEEEEIPLKKTVTADRDGVNDKSDRVPPGATVDVVKQAQVVNVRGVQKILKHLHSKTRKFKRRWNKDTTENSGNLQSEEASDGVLKGLDKDMSEPQVRSRTSPLNSDSVDRNHNHILSPITPRENKLAKENTNTSAEEDVLLSADELQGPVLHCFPRRRGQTGEGQGPEPLQCSEGSPQMSDKVLSPCNITASLTHHHSSPQTPNRNSPAPNCYQEEEVDADVDILHYSPLPLSSLNENEQVNIYVFPEEGEEEDESEIDVTDD